MDCSDIQKVLEAEFGKPKGFQPHVLADVANQRLTIFLEDCSYYAQWIRGEDGDVAIYRANDDNRVVGAFLPLRKWNGQLPVEVL